MPKFSLNQILFFLLFAAIFALTFAYISQFYFDHQPCVLCLYQRQPFFAIIAISILSLTFFKTEKLKKISVIFCLLFLLINCAIAFYHVGVEEKFFAGPTTCSSENLDQIQNLEELKSAIMTTKAIRCDQPSFVFLGLSMAAWNFIYCLFLFFFGSFLIRKFNRTL